MARLAEDWVAVAVDVAAGIAEVGQAAVLRRAGAATGPVYDPIPGAPVDWSAAIVAVGIEAEDRPGTMILAGDRNVLIAAAGIYQSPEVGDTMVIADPGAEAVAWPVDGPAVSGKSWRLAVLRPLAPAGVVVMWEAWVRR